MLWGVTDIPNNSITKDPIDVLVFSNCYLSRDGTGLDDAKASLGERLTDSILGKALIVPFLLPVNLSP